MSREKNSANKLVVQEMALPDCWKDMARIPREHRVDIKGKRIGKAEICKVVMNGKSKLLAIRADPEDGARILLDAPTRVDFNVRAGQEYEVELHRVGWFGYWRWAWDAADPSFRVPAQISIISFALGCIGLILGALSLWPIVQQWLSSK